jgi:hypothetical protein
MASERTPTAEAVLGYTCASGRATLRHPKQSPVPTTFPAGAWFPNALACGVAESNETTCPLGFDGNAPDACSPYVIEVVSFTPFIEAERTVRTVVDCGAVNATGAQDFMWQKKGGLMKPPMQASGEKTLSSSLLPEAQSPSPVRFARR